MSPNEHYFSESPDVKLKLYTVSESLRRHLYIFKTVTGIFSFRKLDLGTKILIENMIIPDEPSFLLDLGCGYGPIGIVLGYEAPKSIVYMVDINKRAIWIAKQNVKLNIAEYKKRVFAINGDYFEPIKSKNLKFDGIYMNPPLRQGKKQFLDLFDEINNYLKDSGFFQFIIKRKMGAESILKNVKDLFPQRRIDIICKRSGYWVFNFY